MLQLYTKFSVTSMLCALLMCASQTAPKAIIWDLGYTLIHPSKMFIAKKLGLSDAGVWYLKHGKKAKSLLHDSVFDVLADACGMNTESEARDMEGNDLPNCMCDWLDGSKTAECVLQKAKAHISDYKDFLSAQHKKLTLRTLEWLFTPRTFALSMRPIKKAVRILKACAQNPNNQLYILSNWDPESFEIMYKRKSNNVIFKHFERQNIYVSGFIGDIKPNASIFKYMLDDAGLKPEDCIFIDDQLENIESARKLGITALHIKDKNYQALRCQLKELGVI